MPGRQPTGRPRRFCGGWIVGVWVGVGAVVLVGAVRGSVEGGLPLGVVVVEGGLTRGLGLVDGGLAGGPVGGTVLGPGRRGGLMSEVTRGSSESSGACLDVGCEATCCDEVPMTTAIRDGVRWRGGGAAGLGRESGLCGSDDGVQSG